MKNSLAATEASTMTIEEQHKERRRTKILQVVSWTISIIGTVKHTSTPRQANRA